MKPPPISERQAQRSILQMIGRCFPAVVYHHSPNGAHLAGGDAARFKQIGALKGDGMKCGWPDIVTHWNHGTAYMEVKAPGRARNISPDQRAVHELLASMGFPVAIVTNEAEAFQILIDRGAPWNRLKPLSMMEAA